MAPRAFFALAILALTAFVGGCRGDENAVHITARSNSSVETLLVRTTILDPQNPQTRTRRNEMINRTAEEINADRPIKIAVDLSQAGTAVMIHIEGTTLSGARLVATRCYTVSGIIEDEVLLVMLTSDTDGDGFVVDPSEACQEPGGGPCDYQCSAEFASDCNEGTACDPVEEPCDRDAMTGCCNPPQDSYPGATEICLDGVDQDCSQPWAPNMMNGDIDCSDNDGDTFAPCSPDDEVGTCDCDDSDPEVLPSGLPESRDPEDGVCNNGIDENCDGVDECCDADGDGYCGAPRGLDCDDADPAINPGASEVCTISGEEPIDENCNGLTDELPTCAPDDQDKDEYPDCSVAAPGEVCDCNDCDSGIHPGAVEICGDGIDQNCDGVPVAGDLTGDECSPADMDLDGFVDGARDCNDALDTVYLGAPEACNAVDDDCDGTVDNGCEGDTDADGWAEPASCEGDASVNPGVAEACDEVDNDCDGSTNEVFSASTVMYPNGQAGCVTCPPDTGRVWCGVDLTGNDSMFPPTDADSTLRQRLSFLNCGGCRVSCNTIEDNECADGTCGCTFNRTIAGGSCDGERCCGTGCEALDDEANCGSCGFDCNAGRLDTRPASDNCADLDGDGSIGECACGTGAACGAGQICCGGACVADNGLGSCGSCDNRCFTGGGNPGQTCADPGNPTTGTNYQCNCATSGWADCRNGNEADGCETDLQNDVNNCGVCGRRCNVANGSATCRRGMCEIGGCNTGFADCDGNVSNGCEINTTNNVNNCNGCGNVCSVANGSPRCRSSRCEVSSCNGGYGDCNGGYSNGCETRTNTLTNCTGCGVSCSRANATPTCASDNCRIQSCNGGYDNCDGSDGNGCEQRLNTLTHCTGCNVSCTRANATATCASDACRIQSCQGNWDNCNGTDADGCERSLRTVTDCGSCNNSCVLANATETCGTGSCRVQSCTGNYGNCDGSHPNGCEQELNTLTHCGDCSTPCNIANGTGTCATGTCQVASCNSGWDNCDGSAANGCETQLGTDSNCNSCGNSCVGFETCGGGGMANTCGCTPITSCTMGQECGTQDNTCGGTVMCGTCGGAEMCCPGQVCINTQNDDNNCGDCGMACGMSETCSGGTCS